MSGFGGVKYAPDSWAVRYFHDGFLYNLDDGSVWVTSMNRIRQWCAAQWVADISRGMILGLLARSDGKLLGEAVNSYSHISTICRINVDKFRKKFFQAIEDGEIRCSFNNGEINQSPTLH